METNPFLSAGTHVPTHIPSHDIPDLSPLTLQVLPNASFALQFIVNKGKIIGGGGGEMGVCVFPPSPVKMAGGNAGFIHGAKSSAVSGF